MHIHCLAESDKITFVQYMETAGHLQSRFHVDVVYFTLHYECDILFILCIVGNNCLILVFLDPNKHADTNTPAAPAVHTD